MMELNFGNTQFFAEEAANAFRNVFGKYGLQVSRNHCKVKLDVSRVNSTFDEKEFVEFLKRYACDIPDDTVLYLNDGIVWKRNYNSLYYFTKDEFIGVVEETVYTGELIPSIFFTRVIVDLNLFEEVSTEVLTLIHINLSMMITTCFEGRYVGKLRNEIEKRLGVDRKKCYLKLDRYAA